MISHSVKSNTNGSGGVVTYLTTTEYYLNRDGKDGGTVWFAGAGAVAFGLKDGMDLEDMRGAMGRMMNGFHPTERDPETGAPVALVQNAGQPCKSEVRLDLDGKPLLKADGLPDMVWTGARVMGHDLTYSPPKAFSALYAMADAERQIAWRAALVEANNVGMQYMAEQGQTRTGSASGGTLQYERADVVWSSHCHFASRDLDPQLHVQRWRMEGLRE